MMVRSLWDQQLIPLRSEVEDRMILEEKYHKRAAVPLHIPSTSFDLWIESFIVSENTLHIACSVSVLEGVKQCILENFQRQKKEKIIPLHVSMRPKQLYLYNDSWESFGDDHLNQFIQEIWRKFLELFLKDSPSDCDEECSHSAADENYRDICMKKILEMRKTLSQRHRKEIMRYLIIETKNRNIL